MGDPRIPNRAPSPSLIASLCPLTSARTRSSVRMGWATPQFMRQARAETETEAPKLNITYLRLSFEVLTFSDEDRLWPPLPHPLFFGHRRYKPNCTLDACFADKGNTIFFSPSPPAADLGAGESPAPYCRTLHLKIKGRRRRIKGKKRGGEKRRGEDGEGVRIRKGGGKRRKKKKRRGSREGRLQPH